MLFFFPPSRHHGGTDRKEGIAAELQPGCEEEQIWCKDYGDAWDSSFPDGIKSLDNYRGSLVDCSWEPRVPQQGRASADTLPKTKVEAYYVRTLSYVVPMKTIRTIRTMSRGKCVRSHTGIGFWQSLFVIRNNYFDSLDSKLFIPSSINECWVPWEIGRIIFMDLWRKIKMIFEEKRNKARRNWE